jgi:tetratricopeptide (TPR) repeat protein
MSARLTLSPPLDSSAIPSGVRRARLALQHQARVKPVSHTLLHRLRLPWQAIFDLLVYYRHFLWFQLGELRLEGLWLAYFFTGTALLMEIATPELLYTVGIEASQGQLVWLVAFALGLPFGVLWTLLGGWVLRLRLRLADKKVTTKEDRKRSNALFAYTSLPAALTWLIYRITLTLFEGLDFVTAPSRQWMVFGGGFMLVLASCYGVYLCYVGVRVLYLPTLGNARRWFLLLPFVALATMTGFRVYRYTQGYNLATQYFNLGVEKRFVHDYPSTIRYYHTALSWLSDTEEERPLVLSLYENLSDLYIRTGNPSQAISSLEHAQEFAPEGSPDSYVLLARMNFIDDKLEEGVSNMNKALKINPQHLDAIAGLARFYMGIETKGAPDYNTALSYNRQLYALNSNYDGARENLAINYYYLGDDASALELLAEEIQLHPRNATAAFYTGLIYNQQNNKEMAEKMMRRAIQLDPNLRTPELEAAMRDYPGKAN